MSQNGNGPKELTRERCEEIFQEKGFKKGFGSVVFDMKPPDQVEYDSPDFRAYIDNTQADLLVWQQIWEADQEE
jgi:hypothetical protein